MYGLRNRMIMLTNDFWKSLWYRLMQSRISLLLIVDRGVLHLIIVSRGSQTFGFHRIAGRPIIVLTVMRSAATTWCVATLFRMPAQWFFGKPFTNALAAQTRTFACAETGSSGRRWL